MKIFRFLIFLVSSFTVSVCAAQIGVKPLMEQEHENSIDSLKQLLTDSITPFNPEREFINQELLQLHQRALSFSIASGPSIENEQLSRMPIFVPDTIHTMPVYTPDSTINHYLKVYGKKEE